MIMLGNVVCCTQMWYVLGWHWVWAAMVRPYPLGAYGINGGSVHLVAPWLAGASSFLTVLVMVVVLSFLGPQVLLSLA